MTARDDAIAWPFAAWVHRQAERRANQPAIMFDGEVITYAAFAADIDRLASGLKRSLGIKAGDRLAYLGQNHPDFLTLLFAAARVGAIVIPLNWRLAPPEHAVILKDCTPSALLAQAPFADSIDALPEAVAPAQKLALDFEREGWRPLGDLLGEDGELDTIDKAEKPALIVYTSGTTGAAKGAVLTQDALYWNAVNSIDMHDLNAEDRILAMLPLFHVGGLNIQTLPAFAVGAEVRLESRFDPATALRLIAETRPTHTILVPAMMKAVIDHSGFEKTDLTSLRQITTGSSIVPSDLIQAFHDRGIPVTQVYGTTETAPIAVYQRRDDAFRTIGSTGRTAKHGEMRLVDDEGRGLGADQPGHVQIRGPQVMTGYWNNPAATEATFDGDWFRTGDIGRLDNDGNLQVEARADDLIKSGSERIYPAEIEDILRTDDDVDEVVVVGKADPKWGEVPVAFVQSKEGAERDAGRLLRHLDGRLARYKWPKEVHFVDALPRSALGKVLRYRLRGALERDE
jgi:fatty-acyl-CoA synthase